MIANVFPGHLDYYRAPIGSVYIFRGLVMVRYAVRTLGTSTCAKFIIPPTRFDSARHPVFTADAQNVFTLDNPQGSRLSMLAGISTAGQAPRCGRVSPPRHLHGVADGSSRRPAHMQGQRGFARELADIG